MKKQKIFLAISFVALSSCNPLQKSNLDVKFSKPTPNSTSTSKIISVSSVQIINHQLVVTGKNLDTAVNVKVDGNSFNEDFVIETQSSTQIIANSLRAVSFDVSKVLNLIISNAEASATFAIDFSLCNATLNGKGFNCSLGANDKDVLSYDANSQTWKPRSATSGLNYLGSFDASTNPSNGPTPYPTAGAYYIIGQDGLIGVTSYSVGDWMVSNGTAWQKIDNSTMVHSVFNRTGAITAEEGDYELDQLLDVDLPGPIAVGKVLKYDGAHWVAGDDDSVGGVNSVNTTAIVNGAITDAKIASIAASKITGTINSTQILDGTIVNADINAAAAIDYSKLNIPNVTIPYLKLNIANGDIPYAKLTIANGEIPAAKISGLPSATAILATTITDNDTTHAPDGNAVYDGLALKLNTSGGSLTSAGTISNVPNPVNPLDVSNRQYTDTKLDKTLGGTVVGSVSLDTELRLKGTTNYVTLKADSATTTYVLTLPATAGTNGYVLSTNGSGVLSWISPSVSGSTLTGDIGGTVGANTIGAGKVTLTHLSATGTKDNTTYLSGDNTWTGFASSVLAAPLTSLSLATGTAITAADSVLSAMGKLQKQLTDIPVPTGTADATTYHAGDNTWKSFASNVRGTVLTGLSSTGITHATRTIASTDSALVAFNKLLFTQSDYVSTSANQTIYGSLKINSLTGFIEVPAPVGLMDATNKQYVDAQVSISNLDGNLVPANSTLLMGSCPSGWTTLGQVEYDPGEANCGGNACYQCRSPSSAVSLPANSILSAESCPSDWTAYEMKNGGFDDEVEVNSTFHRACQSPNQSSLLPGRMRIMMDSCPTSWKKLGQTTEFSTGSAQCPSGQCYSCEVPSKIISPDSIVATSASSPTDSGSSVGLIAGNGGNTSGYGGHVSITAGTAGNVGAGSVFIAAGSTSGGGAAGNVTINSGTSSGNKGVVFINPGNGNKVSIGTYETQAKLDVGGAIRIGSDATICSISSAGSMRYNSTLANFEECDGTSWKNKRIQGTLIPANSVLLIGANGTAGLCPNGWTSLGQDTGDGAADCGTGGNNCSQCQSPAVDSLLPADASVASESCAEGWTKSLAGGTNRAATVYNIPHTACKAPAINTPLPGGMRLLMDQCPAGWRLIGTTILSGLGAATCPSGACKSCEVPGSSSTSNIIVGSGLPGFVGLVGAPGIPGVSTGGRAFVHGGNTTSGFGGPVVIKGGDSDSGAGGTLTLSGGAGGTNGNGGTVSINSGLLAGTGTNGYILLNSGNTALVGIGTSTPSTKLDVTGVVNASGGYTQVSDIRLKTNIKYLDSHDSLEKLLTLRGILYDWKDQKQYGKNRQLGLIAQDVKKVFPDAIRENINGILTVSYSSLIAPIIESLKEIKHWLLNHDEEIKTLKQENALMKSYLCSKDPEASFCN